MYEKAPSLSEMYDSVLSIRSPFYEERKTVNEELIEQILETYRSKNYSEEIVNNIKYILLELTEIKESTDDKKETFKAQAAIDEIKDSKFSLAQDLFGEEIEKSRGKRKAKLQALIASIVFFDEKDKAVLFYQDALTEDRNNLFILNSLGKLYLELKEYRKAESIFKRLIRAAQKAKKPKQLSQAYSNLGVIYLIQKNYSLAHKSFNHALKINQNNNFKYQMATQYNNIALTYEKQKTIDLSCVNYRRARIIYIKNYEDDHALKLENKLKQLECF
jgi:Tfp pilus assembly protein PilF